MPQFQNLESKEHLAGTPENTSCRQASSFGVVAPGGQCRRNEACCHAAAQGDDGLLAALRLLLTLATYVAVIYTRALGAAARAVLYASLVTVLHACLRAAPSEASAKGAPPGVPLDEVLGLRRWRRGAPAVPVSADRGRPHLGAGWLRLRRRWGRTGRGAVAVRSDPHPDPRRLFRELGARGRALAAAACEAAWGSVAAGWRGALDWLRPAPRHSGALGGGGAARLW